jgi:hypothetical protein
LFVAVIVSNLDASRKKMEKLRKQDKSQAAAAKKRAEADQDTISLSSIGTSNDMKSINYRWIQAIRDITHGNQSVDDFYRPTMNAREKKMIGTFLQEFSSLEHNVYLYDRLFTVVDSLMELLRKNELDDASNPIKKDGTIS